jgi:hypothetical protein
MVRGYGRVSSPERAGIGMLTSFSVTIGIARAISYVQERRRHAPALRSWIRRVYQSPMGVQLHIHHFVPGVAIALLAGAAAIGTRQDKRELWFSVPFGIGTGLTLDEIAVMTERGKRYWASETIVARQAATASVGSLALTIRAYYCGARQP